MLLRLDKLKVPKLEQIHPVSSRATNLEQNQSTVLVVYTSIGVNIPLPSFRRTSMISSFSRLSSMSLWPAKAYRALYVSFFAAGGAAGGGGGGARLMEDAESVRPWLVPLIAANGWGTGLD